MKMKKLMLTLGAALASAVSFAEGEAASIVDMSELTGIFTDAQTSMTSLLSAAIPVVTAFVGGGLIIWGALALVSLLKRGFGAGKGR